MFITIQPKKLLLHKRVKRFVNFYTGYTNKALKRRATCAELMCENHFAQKVIQSPERPKVWPECCGFGIDWVSNSKVAVGRELFFLNTTTQELKGNAALIWHYYYQKASRHNTSQHNLDWNGRSPAQMSPWTVAGPYQRLKLVPDAALLSTQYEGLDRGKFSATYRRHVYGVYLYIKLPHANESGDRFGKADLYKSRVKYFYNESLL